MILSVWSYTYTRILQNSNSLIDCSPLEFGRISLRMYSTSILYVYEYERVV